MRYLKGLLKFLFLSLWKITVADSSHEPKAKNFKPSGDLAIDHVMKARQIRKEGKRNWETKYKNHLIRAMKHGHNSGHAPENLAKILADGETLHQAIEVCELVLDSEYQFESNNKEKKADFAKRLARYKKHGMVEPNAARPSLFSPEERAQIVAASKKNALIPKSTNAFVVMLSVVFFGCMTEGNKEPMAIGYSYGLTDFSSIPACSFEGIEVDAAKLAKVKMEVAFSAHPDSSPINCLLLWEKRPDSSALYRALIGRKHKLIDVGDQCVDVDPATEKREPCIRFYYPRDLKKG